MKKQWLSAALVLLLMLLIPVAASADVIYSAPGELVVGEAVDHLLATLDPGSTAWTDPGLLPDGLRLETEETEDGLNVYLRGVPAAAGTYDLVILYNGAESICTVTIVAGDTPAPVPIGVSVETPPLLTQYTAGDTLDPEGLTLRLAMSDGSSQLVTEGYALYPTRLEHAGTRTIEVNYDGLLCYFDVEVEPGPEVIEGIGVLKLPEKIVYEVGEELDPTGLIVRVYTNNGTRDEYWDLLCEPTLLTEPGQQEITVYYEKETCTFTVQVLEAESPASIAVYRLPDRLEYQVGDTLDTSGLVLIETSSRNNPDYLEDGFTCEPVVLETPGSQEITVRLGELRCSFHVTVAEAAPIVATASPAPGEASIPSTAPTAAVVLPSEDPLPQRGPAESAQSGKLLVAVIVVAALLALVVLGVYVLLMNRGSREYFADSVKDLFRRRR